jgi:flagellar motor switch protein FliN/FliY
VAEPHDELLGVEEIDALLKSAELPADPAPGVQIAATPSTGHAERPATLGGAQPRAFQLPPLESNGPADAGASLEALNDVELDLRIELGRTELMIDEVLKLRPGSVVPLDKLAGDPVDILVNGKLVARGEVLVLNDNFCVRVAEILTPARVSAGLER